MFADLSHHQTVDLAAYARAGHDRVILKATEGTGFIDGTFTARWRQAAQLGLARVAYHYARNKFDGADEFDLMWRTVQAAGGLGARDRLCLDTEDVDTPRYAVRQAQQFTARAVAVGVTQGLVYTGNWYVREVARVGGGALAANVFPPGWRRLWLSHYDRSVPDEEIIIPAGWTRAQCVARQYTDRATVPGVVGTCDYSRLLVEWLSTAPTPQEDPMAGITIDDIRAVVADEVKKANAGIYGLTAYGDQRVDTLPDTHPENLQRIRQDIGTLAEKVDQLLAAQTSPAPEPTS